LLQGTCAIMPFMNWLRQHNAEIGALALIVALTALFANFVKIWRSAEGWSIVLNALLAFSTVLLACAAFRALHTWKEQEARKLTISLYRSTDYLVEVTRAACRQGELVAKLGLKVVDETLEFTPELKEFMVDEAPSRVSHALADLLDAKSKWMAEVAVAIASWGDEFEMEVKEFKDLIFGGIQKLEELGHQVPTLRLVIKGLYQQERSQYESLEKELREIPDKASDASRRVTKYLEKHFRL